MAAIEHVDPFSDAFQALLDLIERYGGERLQEQQAMWGDIEDAIQAVGAQGIAEGLRQAKTAVRAQAGLPDLVHFDRPSDFRKGVLTCLAALEAHGGGNRD